MVSDRVLKSIGLLLLLHQTDQYSNFKLFKDTTEFRNILFDCFTDDVEVAHLVQCYTMWYQPLWENLHRIIIRENELKDQMVRCLYFTHNDTVKSSYCSLCLTFDGATSTLHTIEGIRGIVGVHLPGKLFDVMSGKDNYEQGILSMSEWEGLTMTAN